MSSSDFTLLTLQIAVMLACGVVCGHVTKRMGQPAVLGEIVGGILLGPTLFGALAPDVWQYLFSSSASVATARDATIKLGMLLFLFTVGLEVNISSLRRLGKRAATIGIVGTALPILAGVLLVYAVPASFWGPMASTHRLALALFIGMNLANSSNPLIARVLMDLGLLDKEFGTLVMTATLVDDFVNWTLFAIVLGQIDPSGAAERPAISTSIVMVFGLFAGILLIGRLAGPHVAGWMRTRRSKPMTLVAVLALAVLVGSLAAEYLGVHAFLGAFLVGTAIGGIEEVRHVAHDAIVYLALSFFAPVYFVSMGMGTNFVANFDGVLVVLVILVACASKMGSVLLGARFAGMPSDREAWAIAFALNARGASGIILAGVGRERGVIDDRLFVAMVAMALVTSLLSGPAIRWLHTESPCLARPAQGAQGQG